MRAGMAAPGTATCLAMLLLSTACGIRPRPAVPDAGTGTVISAEELAATEATTMWEALQRTVRYANFGESSSGDPARVHRRGFSSISLTEDMPIYIDRIQVRDLTILDALPAADIEQIQVLSGLEATTYYGTNAGDGVILIRTRRGG
ncbi:MAG: TonB-dependent receptor plug domain-containing protein [Gemmatimonadetes bacterium]|nr:TonB-dependent receptor plug domain-containing protein [Gemmatimonadota bacterium]